MSLTSIYLRNFRKIGREGSVVSFSPVTIFTGCNSAGKSTVAKAMILMDSYLSDIRSNNINLIDIPLDFSNIGKLGTFDSVLNVNSKEKGIDEIVLGYEWESPVFVENMQAYFTFTKKEGDQLGNGWLKKLSIAIDSLELFNIQIHNGKYKIEIMDEVRFLEYYRKYMVKQVVSTWETLSERIYEYPDNEKKYHEFMESFSGIKDKMLCHEKDLVESGALRKNLWEIDYNKEIVNNIKPKELRRLISESFSQEVGRVIELQEFMNEWQNYEGNSVINWIDPCCGFLREAYFIKALMNEATNPEFCGRIGYVDSSTIEVKRSYPLDGTNRFGNLWRKYNTIIVSCKDGSEKIYKPGTFINKWLKEFGVCESVRIENEEGHLRIKLITIESPDGRMLADYGYGVTQLVSLLLNIEITISKVEHYFDCIVGMPVACTSTLIKPFWLIIEEPEMHLHPLIQSKLADMFCDASKYGVNLIVETHSEYLVRRSQVLVAEAGYDRLTIEKKNPFKVYYFPVSGSPYDMRYQKTGLFEEPFGEGFFDEAGKWSRLLISLRKN